MLPALLHLEGIDSVVIEKQSRDCIEAVIKAGVLEQGTIDILNAIGAGERMMAEGVRDEGIVLRYDGRDACIDPVSISQFRDGLYH